MKRKMKDWFVASGLARLAACALLSLVGAWSAWGDGLSASPNLHFLRWQKMQFFNRKGVAPNKSKVRLLSAGTDQGDGENYSLGYIPSPVDKSYLRDLNATTPMMASTMGASTVSLDAKYDLRDKDRVTPVKDQGSYGTCWAHGTMASIESWLLTNENTSYDFSEKHLAQKVDYTGYSYGTKYAKYGYKIPWAIVKSGIDGGGSGDRATSYLTQWKGPVLETVDPYPNNSYLYSWLDYLLTHEGSCLNDFLPPSPDVTPVGHVQKVRWIPMMHYTDDRRTVMDELVAIKQALMTYGVLSTSYYNDWSCFKKYNGKSQATYCYRGTETSPNHIVAIVGWDDNFKKENFVSNPPGDGAFIAKNSWGTSFGDNGYFYVSYYDRYFAKDELMSFSNIEPVDNYASIYQYDPQGLCERWSPVSGGSETALAANMFVARESEDLAAVGFYAFVPNTKYEMSVYVNCNNSNPVSGSIQMSQGGETDCAGFVTIPFKQTVSVTKGRRFSIVIKLNTPGDNKPLALEGFRWLQHEEVEANAGESFVYIDNQWKDLTTFRMPFSGSGTYNFCCKVYTKSATAPKPTLLSIDVAAEDGKTVSVKPGDKVQLKCEARYSNNSTSNVTQSAQWSLTLKSSVEPQLRCFFAA